MELKIFEMGFNFSQDGPGNRLVIHLGGCNMRCPWCSNPEGMNIGEKYDSIATEALAKKIVSSKPMFFDGGGVTFTGGECSLQADALEELTALLKQEDISVAIESNASTAAFLKLAKLSSYVICDYKHPNSKKLKEVTGGDLALIESNIKAALKLTPLHIRIPLIGGFNNSPDDFEGFKDFFLSLKEISDDFDVEILRYHEYGKEKWEKLGREYNMANAFVSLEEEKALASILKENEIKIIKS